MKMKEGVIVQGISVETEQPIISFNFDDIRTSAKKRLFPSDRGK